MSFNQDSLPVLPPVRFWMTKTCEGGSGRRTTNPPPGKSQTIKLSPGNISPIHQARPRSCWNSFSFRVKPFICTMPMRLDDGWNQIQVCTEIVFSSCAGKNFISSVQPCGLHKASVWHKLCGDIEGRAIASSSYLTSFVMERKKL